jgi:hypothetical protein
MPSFSHGQNNQNEQACIEGFNISLSGHVILKGTKIIYSPLLMKAFFLMIENKN